MNAARWPFDREAKKSSPIGRMRSLLVAIVKDGEKNGRCVREGERKSLEDRDGQGEGKGCWYAIPSIFQPHLSFPFLILSLPLFNPHPIVICLLVSSAVVIVRWLINGREGTLSYSFLNRLTITNAWCSRFWGPRVVC